MRVICTTMASAIKPHYAWPTPGAARVLLSHCILALKRAFIHPIQAGLVVFGAMVKRFNCGVRRSGKSTGSGNIPRHHQIFRFIRLHRAEAKFKRTRSMEAGRGQ
jgi:hypothetical protein